VGEGPNFMFRIWSAAFRQL